MHVDLVITYYDPSQKKVEMLCNLMRSIGAYSTRHSINVIIVTNGPSYPESVNLGLRRSTGDYVIVLNDDVEIRDADWIDKMCQPGCITGWQLGVFHIKKVPVPDAACFAMSREVFQRVGYMDEKFKEGFNFEDTDYFFRAMQMGLPMVDAKVDLLHIGNQTVKTYFSEAKAAGTHRNETLFRERWMPYLESLT